MFGLRLARRSSQKLWSPRLLHQICIETRTEPSKSSPPSSLLVSDSFLFFEADDTLAAADLFFNRFLGEPLSACSFLLQLENLGAVKYSWSSFGSIAALLCSSGCSGSPVSLCLHCAFAAVKGSRISGPLLLALRRTSGEEWSENWLKLLVQETHKIETSDAVERGTSAHRTNSVILGYES